MDANDQGQYQGQYLEERKYLECPNHKGNAMRSVEVCYFKCAKYDKCPAVKSAYKEG